MPFYDPWNREEFFRLQREYVLASGGRTSAGYSERRPAFADAPGSVPTAEPCSVGGIDCDDTPDPISPSHYRSHPSGVEAITITEHANFNLGNAIKYLWRVQWGRKPGADPVEDLKKAKWYVEREIERRQGNG